MSTELNSSVLGRNTVGGLVKGKGCVGMKGGASVGILSEVNGVVGVKAGYGKVIAQENCGKIPRPSGLGAGNQVGGNGGVGYGFDTVAAKDAKAFAGSYMPVKRVNTQCGGKKNKKSHKGKTNKHKKSHKNKTHKRNHKKAQKPKHHKKSHKVKKHNKRGKKHTMKGGYAQYSSNVPNTPGYGMPNVNAMPSVANGSPAPLTRQVNCVDNYNHFTGKGAKSPVLDQATK